MPKSVRFFRLLLPLVLAAAAAQPLAAQQDIVVPANTTLNLNNGGSYQNITVGTNAALSLSNNNSGGAGDSAVTYTLAAAGPASVQNDGSVQFIGGFTNFVLANPLTFSGAGVLSFGSVESFTGPGPLINNAGHTVVTSTGGPVIPVSLVNAGTIIGQNPGLYNSGPTFSGPTITNTGTIRSETDSGGALHLTGGTINNAGGVIAAATPQADVIFDNGVRVSGGTLVTPAVPFYSGDGVLRLQGGSTLADLTVAPNSVVSVANTGALAGTITNQGAIYVPGGRFSSTLSLAGDTRLTGNGLLYLGGPVASSNGATLTVDANQTLQGAGGLYYNGGSNDSINANLVNNGTVAAVYLEFYISGASFVNNGAVVVNDGSSLQITSSVGFANFRPADGALTGGAYTVTDQGDGATLDLAGRAVRTNAAAISLSGPNARMDSLNGLSRNVGSLSLLAQKQQTLSGDFDNAGTINLDAGSTLRVNGDFTASNAASSAASSAQAAGQINGKHAEDAPVSKLRFTVGGTDSQGAHSPGVLQIAGVAKVAGLIEIALADLTTPPSIDDTLTVLSAKSVSGSFANAPGGTRVATADGRGSFLVTYGESSVGLSRFLAPGQMDSAPVVTLTALIPTVRAGSGEYGEFLLTLSSAQTSDLFVNYAIKGSAVNGTDYILLKGTKKIKAGKTSKPIKVIPQGDLGGAAKKTVVLTLLPGDGYQLSKAGKVKVKVKLTD